MAMHNHGQKVDGWATTFVFLGILSHCDGKRGKFLDSFLV